MWQKEAIEKDQARLNSRISTEEKLTAERLSSVTGQLAEHKEELETVHKSVKRVSAQVDNVPSTEFDPVAATPHFQPQYYPSVVECWEHHRLVRQREEEEESQARAVRRRLDSDGGSSTERYLDSASEGEYDSASDFKCAQRS